MNVPTPVIAMTASLAPQTNVSAVTALMPITASIQMSVMPILVSVNALKTVTNAPQRLRGQTVLEVAALTHRPPPMIAA